MENDIWSSLMLKTIASKGQTTKFNMSPPLLKRKDVGLRTTPQTSSLNFLDGPLREDLVQLLCHTKT